MGETGSCTCLIYSTALHCPALHYTPALSSSTLHRCTVQHYTKPLHLTAMHSPALHYTTGLSSTALHHCTVQHYTAQLYCPELQCTALLCTTNMSLKIVQYNAGVLYGSNVGSKSHLCCQEMAAVCFMVEQGKSPTHS